MSGQRAMEFATIYRKGIAVERLSTLAAISRSLGMDKSTFAGAKYKGSLTVKPVAKFGSLELYIIEEVEAWHRSRGWANADRESERLYKGAI